jgi:hypothetical protein
MHEKMTKRMPRNVFFSIFADGNTDNCGKTSIDTPETTVIRPTRNTRPALAGPYFCY